MARSKSNDVGLELFLKLGALVCMLCVLSPLFRNGLILMAILLFALLIVCGVGFLIYRRLFRPEKSPWQPSPLPNTEFHYLAEPSKPFASASIPRIETAADLIERIRKIDWYQFEKVVALVYENLGYVVSRRGGANPDGGIDLIVEKDKQRKAIQCKHWKTWNVGIKAVREFLGALTAEQIKDGVFVTLRGYSAEAKQFADKHGIEIINERGLVEMLENANARYNPEFVEILNDTRKICPKCERKMVLRTATKGPNRGGQFWGCSAYPRCRFTMQVQ